MIFRDLAHDPASSQKPVDAWWVVERTQRDRSPHDWIVTQPDHAHISGALAANFRDGLVPHLTADVVEGIRLHDQGWQLFDGIGADVQRPPLDGNGRTVSFFELPPATFLRAWRGSIEAAGRVSPAAGYVVSRHFVALAERSLMAAKEKGAEAEMVEEFLRRELQRERQVVWEADEAARDRLVRVLQFCDLLSLYVCCGAGDPARFALDFGFGTIIAEYEGKALHLTPSPLHAELKIAIPCAAFTEEGLVARTDQITIR